MNPNMNAFIGWSAPSLLCSDERCQCQANFKEISFETPQQSVYSGISQLVAASDYLDKVSVSTSPTLTTTATKATNQCIITNPRDQVHLSFNTYLAADSTTVPFSTNQDSEERALLQSYSGIASNSVIYGSAQPSKVFSGVYNQLNGHSNHSNHSDQSLSITSMKQKVYFCRFCNKGFAQKGNLKTHLMIHNGEKPFVCEVCGKRFTQKGNVDIHMTTHTGERNYRCGRCGKQFSQKGNLKTHLYSVHMKSRPFQCQICGKHFSQKVNLHSHYRTHNNGDRLPCSLCKKTFAHKGSLKAHLQGHFLEQYNQDLLQLGYSF